MEIALLSKGTLRIKEKNAMLVVDPHEKEQVGANGIILLEYSSQTGLNDESVILNGPGEYEVAGIKISGTKKDRDTIYSLRIEGVEVLLGQLHALEKMQHKLQEHNVVIVQCSSEGSPSFLTSLASNVIILYGERAAELVQSIGKGDVKTMSKYAVTLGKLPTEVETILLANS
jgi:hypothetical protein